MLVKVPFPLLPVILDGRIFPWDGGALKRRSQVLSSPLVLRLFSNLISFDGQHDNGRFTGEQLAIMLVEIAFAFLGALSSASLHSRSPWQFRIRKDMACKSWNGASLAFPCLFLFLLVGWNCIRKLPHIFPFSGDCCSPCCCNLVGADPSDGLPSFPLQLEPLKWLRGVKVLLFDAHPFLGGAFCE